MKKKKSSIKSLQAKAWKLMSEYVRRSNCHKNSEFVSCISCGKPYHWKEVHAGHFLHAGKGGKGNAVSYDDRNIHPQCPGCNYYGSRGEAQLNYARFMFTKYGTGILDELKSIKAQSNLRHDDLEQIIVNLQKKIAHGL